MLSKDHWFSGQNGHTYHRGNMISRVSKGSPIGLVDATLISNGRSLRIWKLQNDYERLKKAHVFPFPWPGFPRYFSAVLWAEKSKLPCLPPFNSNFDMKIVHGKDVGMEDIPKIQEWRRWRLFKAWNGSVRCYQMLSHRISGKGDLEAKTPNSPGKARDKREPSSWFPHFIGIFRTSPSISSRTTDLGEHPSVLRADKQENICSTGPYRCDPSTKAAELWSILISEHTFHVSSNVSTSDEHWRILPFPR